MTPIDVRPLRRWQGFFSVAAAWNLIAAATGLLFPEFTYQMMYRELPPMGPAATQDRMFTWVAVGLFGLGYALVARNPMRNHAVVLLGMFGKIYVVIAWGGAWLMGLAGPLALIGAVGDACFAVGFAAALFTLRR